MGIALVGNESLVYLTYLAVILLVGIICSLISNKLKISNVLFLVLAGIVISSIEYPTGNLLFQFSPVFLTSISILALVMILFDASSRLKLSEIDEFSMKAVKLSVVFLIVNMVLLSLAAYVFYPGLNIFLLLAFSALMSGTSPDVALVMLKNSTNKVIKFLEIESIINTPFIVIIPFILLDFIARTSGGIAVSDIVAQLGPFLKQFIMGIGAGVVIGIILFKIMRKFYSEQLSPLVMIAAALLTYILAENLDGSGVLAVTALGILFGRFYVKQKALLMEYSSMFSNLLEILVFVLVGVVIKIPMTWQFLLSSLVLFAVHVIIRLLSIQISLKNGEFSMKDKIFMSLNISKGISVAVVAFMMATISIDGISHILNLILAFIIYSIFLSTILSFIFSSYFKQGAGQVKKSAKA